MHPTEAAATFTKSTEELILCPAAGIAFQPPETIRPFEYSGDYFDNYVDRKGTEIAGDLNRVRAQVVARAIGPLSSQYSMHLVDIGIGSGEFLEFLGATRAPTTEERGRRMDRMQIRAARGFDINPVAVDWLNEHSLFQDPYQESIPEDGIVTLWDTIEHMPDPDAFFACLAPGALLCTSLPIYSKIDRDLIVDSRHYKPNEHLYYFTRGGFINWMERSGFDYLFSDDGETRAGRDSIVSFAFRKRPA